MRHYPTALSRAECLARLSTQRIGRVSISRRALPEIVPVTYEYDGREVVLRAPFDPDFAEICDRVVLAFEVGNGDADWSVHVVGVGAATLEHAVRLDLERMTGRCHGVDEPGSR